MEIKRDIYLNKLIERKHNGFVKIITGIRRCGKSYLLNTIFYNHLIESGVARDHIIRFAFDSASDLAMIDEDLLDLENEKQKVSPKKFIKFINNCVVDDDKHYLLLDEIQKLENFETVLNGYLRDLRLDVYVTGSNSKLLSTDIVTEFAGRGDEVHILPLSFAEFYSARNDSLDSAFDDYVVYGGLPAVALTSNPEIKTTYLTAQFKNVYMRDIARRYNLHGDQDINELVEILASGISTLVNPKKLSDTFASVKKSKISQYTVGKYIDYMEDAFIISKSKRYDVKGKSYISTPYKLYFEDIGIRNAVLNFRQIEPDHIMENIIYNELKTRGYSVDVGVVEVRETTNDNKEIRKYLEVDFIANQGSKRYYVQSAYSIPNIEKKLQETRSFDNIKDSCKKIIIVKETMQPRRDEKGYVMMGIKEFLLSPNSLEF